MDNTASFIPNRPIGQDLLDGKSQENVALAIKKHIEEVDSSDGDTNVLPRIIGVEGTWGSGKSNMLLQLEEKMKSNYFFFTYDSWGNQEDLQRRSILEQLTEELIKKNLLVKDTEIQIINTDLDREPTPFKCTWKRRLFSLVARKSATHNVTIPRIEDSVKWFALSLLAVGIMAAIVGSIQFVNCVILNFIILLIISLLPFFAFCVLRKCKHNKQLKGEKELKGWAWDEMWKMYQTEGTQDTTSYTISELEPSVTEFRNWLNDLAKSLQESMHLVVIFDNMDRLPKEKVRQLWSSIQTFFAGNEYNKVWCIIPFDRIHLANAFAEKDIHITNLFIEKTFPVVYRIPAPIITDYRGVFKKLFEMAFGVREEQDIINRCYRLMYNSPNMREMISYLNKCVALNHTWGEEIRLTSIALFVLNKDIILSDSPDEKIISGDYIGVYEGIIEMDDELPIEMSSLVYGVNKKKAAQLPLKNIIEKSLTNDEESSFDQYAKDQSGFFDILDEVTSSMDPVYLDNAIIHISTINKEPLSEDNIKILDKIWLRLGRVYTNKTQFESSFRKEVRILLDNCPKIELKNKILRRYLELFTTGEKNVHTGKEWYDVYKEVDEYINDKKLDVILPDIIMTAGDYFEYVLAAKDAYNRYPITTNNEEINSVALDMIKEGADIKIVLDLVKDDERFDLSELLSNARNLVEREEAIDKNIEAILNVCKTLSNMPLKLNVNLSYLNKLSQDGGVVYDLQLLRIVQGMEINGMDDSYYEQIANIAYNYYDTYEIWEKTLSLGTQAMARIMSVIITQNRYQGDASLIKDVITEMASIVRRTGVQHQSIVKFVNDWGKTSLNDVEKKVVLSSTFSDDNWCRALLLEKNELSKSILEKYYIDFNTQPLASFVNANNAWVDSNNSYWLRTLKILIDSAVFKRNCSDKLVEIIQHVIDGIMTGQIINGNNNTDLQQKMLQWVAYGKVSSKINDIMSKVGNVPYVINKYKFVSLHHFMEKTVGYQTQYLNYVLKPIIADPEVQDIITNNSVFYEPMMQDNMIQASDLKIELIRLHGTTANEQFKAMIDRLGLLEDIKPNSPSEEGSV